MWAAEFERECADGYGYMVKGGVNELGHRAVTTPGILPRLRRRAYAIRPRGMGETVRPRHRLRRTGLDDPPARLRHVRMNETAYGRRPYVEKLALTPDGQRLYLRPDGTPKRVGDPVRNPDLAATLGRIARDGVEAFYTGEIGRRIVADMAAHGGLLPRDDLAELQAGAARAARRRLSRPPHRGDAAAGRRHHGRGRCCASSSASTWRRSATIPPSTSGIVAEAMKIAGRDKDEKIGDPAFVPAPLDELLSDALRRRLRGAHPPRREGVAHARTAPMRRTPPPFPASMPAGWWCR